MPIWQLKYLRISIEWISRFNDNKNDDIFNFHSIAAIFSHFDLNRSNSREVIAFGNLFRVSILFHFISFENLHSHHQQRRRHHRCRRLWHCSRRRRLPFVFFSQMQMCCFQANWMTMIELSDVFLNNQTDHIRQMLVCIFPQLCVASSLNIVYVNPYKRNCKWYVIFFSAFFFIPVVYIRGYILFSRHSSVGFIFYSVVRNIKLNLSNLNRENEEQRRRRKTERIIYAIKRMG